MKVLVDTNVILDVLLKRDGLYAESAGVFQLVEQHVITGCVSSSAITDIFYLVRKAQKDITIVYQAVDVLAALFTIVPVFESTIKGALALRWKDFEDAVQYSAAKENKLDCIVTRNKDDYTASDIPCVSPVDFPVFYKSAESTREEW
jgi:predicted nucleic acid-binding protein